MAKGDKGERLRDLKRKALQSGGPERMAARDKEGAMTARGRVVELLDPGTFVELDLFVDGAVAGHGKVDGRDVYVFSLGWTDGAVPTDISVPASEAVAGGAVQKIVKIVDMAMKNGAPVVGLWDCGLDDRRGARGGYTEVFFRSVMASGLVPQISAVMGPCGGGAAYPPAMTDVVVMVKGTSHLFRAAPQAVKTETGEETTYEDLGGALVHAGESGVAHLAVDDEAQGLQTIRRLLGYLPQNNLDTAPVVQTGDPVDRADDGLDSYAVGDGDGPRDVREVIGLVVDGGEFLEMQGQWATNLVTGFARLGGRSVGVVANQPTVAEGRVDVDAATKGARFVRFCDAFNLPLLTLVDTAGFVLGVGTERGGAVRHEAKLLCAYCEATVPKLTVITGKAYGEAYEAMGSKHTKADFSFAWPTAELRAAGLGATADAGGTEAGDPRGVAVESAADRGLAVLYDAAERGLLDDIIAPQETRPRLVAALNACVFKREGRPPKKHGNIPL